VTAAIQNNDAAARDQLLQNPQTPEQVKTLLGAAGGDSGAQLNQAFQALDGAQAAAVQQGTAQAQAAQTAVKQAFAASITGIYRYVTGLVALAFLVTLALPEIPLRKSNTDDPEDVDVTAQEPERASFRRGVPADDTI